MLEKVDITERIPTAICATDTDTIKDMIEVFKKEIEKLEAEILSRNENDDIPSDPLTVRKILRIDYDTRKIIRHIRYLRSDGKCVKRRRESGSINIARMLGEKDNKESLLMLTDGFHFTYVKDHGKFVPAIVSNHDEIIKLPKDFLDRLNMNYYPEKNRRLEKGGRLSITKTLEGNKAVLKKRKKN